MVRTYKRTTSSVSDIFLPCRRERPVFRSGVVLLAPARAVRHVLFHPLSRGHQPLYAKTAQQQAAVAVSAA